MRKLVIKKTDVTKVDFQYVLFQKDVSTKFITAESEQLFKWTDKARHTDTRIRFLHEIVEWIQRAVFRFLKANLAMLQQGHRERRQSKRGLHQSQTWRSVSSICFVTGNDPCKES